MGKRGSMFQRESGANRMVKTCVYCICLPVWVGSMRRFRISLHHFSSCLLMCVYSTSAVSTWDEAANAPVALNGTITSQCTRIQDNYLGSKYNRIQQNSNSQPRSPLFQLKTNSSPKNSQLSYQPLTSRNKSKISSTLFVAIPFFTKTAPTYKNKGPELSFH